MSSVAIQFNEADLRKIRDFQRQVPHLLEDIRLKQNIGQLLSAQAKTNIEEQTPDGKTPYLPLSAKYEKYKGFSTILVGRKRNNQTKRGTTNNKGVQSGILKKSIDWSMGPGNIIYLSTISYGKYHQFGTVKMEARPIFFVRDENREDIMHFIESAFKRLVNNHT